MNDITPQDTHGRPPEWQAYDAIADLAERSEAYRHSQEFKDMTRATVIQALGARIEQLAEFDKAAVMETLAFALEDLGAGTPMASLVIENARSDAEWWADCASPVEIEAYTASGLKAISKTMWGLPARKRLIALLWRGLSPNDRAGFLRHVGGQDA